MVGAFAVVWWFITLGGVLFRSTFVTRIIIRPGADLFVEYVAILRQIGLGGFIALRLAFGYFLAANK
jgi:hypothetical protein